MAHVFPPVAGAGPVPIVHHQYGDFYADASNDTANGVYANMLVFFAIFLAGADGATVAPVVLTNDVYASAVHDPQAFIMLCSPDMANIAAPGVVTLFRRLQRYQPQLGNPAPTFDSNGYAFHVHVR